MDALSAGEQSAVNVLSELGGDSLSLGTLLWGEEEAPAVNFSFFDDVDINDLLYKDTGVALPALPLEELTLGVPPPSHREKVVTHSRKRKHEVPNTHVPRKQRCRSTFSYKFQTVEEEVYYRLYEPRADAKSAKLNALVRACYTRFGETYVSWESIKSVAVEVGYSPRNNMFRTVWALTVSRYGRKSEGAQNNEVFGLNFPYWTLKQSEGDAAPRKRGSMLLRLSPEFFQYTPPVLV